MNKLNGGLNSRLFIKRFTQSDGKTGVAQLARLVATIAAEDANTAIYVREYNSGNFGSREDYIDYMANRLEFELKKVGVR